MYGYIYMTTNKVNGKRYIGKHKLNGREKSYIGSGAILRKAIEKYGKENFENEIIEECETVEKLNEREEFYINKHNACFDKSFYNIAKGGTGGDVTTGMTKERYEEYCENFKGENNPMYGVHRYGEDAPMYGKKMSEETKRKISEARKGQHLSEETKAKVKKTLKEKYKNQTHHLAMKILAIDENGKEVGDFTSMQKAAIAYNTSPTRISRLCKSGIIDKDFKVSFKKA